MVMGDFNWVTDNVDRVDKATGGLSGADDLGEQRDAEMERLVYEEYETGMHELPALSLEIDNSRWGHLCCMRDREIEFFGRSLPSVN